MMTSHQPGVESRCTRRDRYRYARYTQKFHMTTGRDKVNVTEPANSPWIHMVVAGAQVMRAILSEPANLAVYGNRGRTVCSCFVNWIFYSMHRTWLIDCQIGIGVVHAVRSWALDLKVKPLPETSNIARQVVQSASKLKTYLSGIEGVPLRHKAAVRCERQ